jgi:hypothetical protein
MTQTVTKQYLEKALKKYKTENSITNIYFHLDNYDNDKIIMNPNQIIHIHNKKYTLNYNFLSGSTDYIGVIIKQAYIKPHETVIISIVTIITSTIISHNTFMPETIFKARCAFVTVDI